MVHWKSFALGLLSVVPSMARAAPVAADVAERGPASCLVIVEGPPITAITSGTPVTGLQLARSSTGAAVLATTGFNTLISYANGGLGEFYFCNYYWLNIGASTHSYKPLSWGYNDEETLTWSAGSGQLVTALATSTYSKTSKFLACSEGGVWVLYLQTGSDVPAGETCVTTQLQVGTS